MYQNMLSLVIDFNVNTFVKANIRFSTFQFTIDNQNRRNLKKKVNTSSVLFHFNS